MRLDAGMCLQVRGLDEDVPAQLRAPLRQSAPAARL